jgi:alkanesulfonate monooxygenase SsuD/methylene tetrahydromethanopterin reductase-like flavin-dependent oxidoreductase (luciferase family)
VYLTWGEPPQAVAEKLDAVRTRAKAAGRELRFGIRLHVITRNTAGEAWAQAQRLLDGLDPAAIERAQGVTSLLRRGFGGRALRVPGCCRPAGGPPSTSRPRDPAGRRGRAVRIRLARLARPNGTGRAARGGPLRQRSPG